MKPFAWILGITLLLLGSACDREAPQPVDQLPPATQEGANTFGCLVDGEVFLPKNDDVFRLPYYASYGYGNLSGTVRFFAGNTDQDIGFLFVFEKILTEPTYFSLPSRDTTVNGAIILNPEIFFSIDNVQYQTIGGFVNITALDTLDVRFVSGTFSCDFVNETDNTDTVSVTDGRFDLKF